MRNILLLLALTVIFGSQIVFSQTTKVPVVIPTPEPPIDYNLPKWVDFVSPEGLFKARFPEKPLTRKIIKPNTGDITAIIVRGGNQSFIVYEIKVTEFLEKEAPKKVFDDLQQKNLKEKASETKLLSSSETKRNDCSARLVEFDADSDLRYRQLYILCETRLIEATVKTFRNQQSYPEKYTEVGNAFLSSIVPLKEVPQSALNKPANSNWVRLSDDELRFAIDFPAEPELTQKEPAENEVADTFDFDATAEEMNYSVNVFKLGLDFSLSEKIREKLYSTWTESFLKESKAKVVANEKSMYKGFNARLLVCQIAENKRFYVKLIALDGKLYTIQLLDVSSVTDVVRMRKVAENASKFFNSFFKFDEIAPPKFYGTVIEENYTSEFYGISLDLPTGWEVDGGQVYVSNLEGNKEEFFTADKSKNLTSNLLEAGKKKDGKLSIGLKLSVITSLAPLPKSIADLESAYLERPDRFELLNKFKMNKVGESEIWQADLNFLVENKKIKVRQVVFQKEKYAFNLMLSYFDDESLKEIDKIIQSLKLIKRR